jgi:glycosyltransferase involved in cell wall biosynthesis
MRRDRHAQSAMRVLHVITDLDVGGAEAMLARLLGAIDRRRVETAVISLDDKGPMAERIERSGISVSALGATRAAAMPFALWRLVRMIRQYQPDVIQTWLYHADFAGTLAAMLTGTPVVWNIRCAELDRRDHPRSLAPLLKALARLSKRATAIVCNSRAGRAAHERLGYTPPRWELIPNGFDVDACKPRPEARNELRRTLALPAEATIVGLLARLHPMKDHETFLRAAAMASARQADVHFVAAGRGVPENVALRGMVRGLGLEKRVHFLSERLDPTRFLDACDVVVSSSYGEAFPNVIGEAMACGVPCVATDVGDTADIVGDAGILVRPRDPEALAAGVLQILALDSESRARLSAAARRRIEARFSLSTIAAQYEQFYLELAGRSADVGGRSICAG